MRNVIPQMGWVLVVLSLLCGEGVCADEFIIDYDNSLLGFVNHKRGIASGLIVDPLTYPGEYEVSITLNPSIETATFSVRYEVKTLRVAGSEKLRRWGRPILDAGAAPKPLEAPSRSRQRKIRKTVISKKFMDAAHYPEVRVESLGIEAMPGGAGKNPHTHNMTIEIAMHGKTVKATFPATIILDDDHLSVDAAFPLLLSDFNIKPYSGFFGAIKFSNQFHVYMHFEARRITNAKIAP